MQTGANDGVSETGDKENVWRMDSMLVLEWVLWVQQMVTENMPMKEPKMGTVEGSSIGTVGGDINGSNVGLVNGYYGRRFSG